MTAEREGYTTRPVEMTEDADAVAALVWGPGCPRLTDHMGALLVNVAQVRTVGSDGDGCALDMGDESELAPVREPFEAVAAAVRLATREGGL